MIYPLIVLPIRSDAGRNRGGEHALIALAENTGGEAFVQHDVQDLDAAFGEILRNLRTQYLLGYYPPEGEFTSTDAFREVQVRVAREGAAVLVRNGYFAKGPVERPIKRRRTAAQIYLRTVPQADAEDDQSTEAPEAVTRPPRRTPGRRVPIIRPGP